MSIVEFDGPPSWPLFGSKGHNFILPRVRTSRFKSTFVNRCLFSSRLAILS